MNKLLLSFILFCCSLNLQSQSKLACYADSFNILNTKVRDQTIGKARAQKLAALYLRQIRIAYRSTPLKPEWHFPLAGYDLKAIGGINGNGYLPKGYNYFDGNKHLGHAAHDIFIKDVNQDAIDDRTKKEVKVLSISRGVVVAIETDWKPSSELRGGKYIYVYDPVSQLLFYYAHNEKILVKVCDVVREGDVIGTVGRTGKNAFKKRSPTHLHLMVLQTDSANFLKPVNIYQQLITAKTVQP